MSNTNTDNFKRIPFGLILSTLTVFYILSLIIISLFLFLSLGPAASQYIDIGFFTDYFTLSYYNIIPYFFALIFFSLHEFLLFRKAEPKPPSRTIFNFQVSLLSVVSNVIIIYNFSSLLDVASNLRTTIFTSMILTFFLNFASIFFALSLSTRSRIPAQSPKTSTEEAHRDTRSNNEDSSFKDKYCMKSERNAKLVSDLRSRADGLYSVGNKIITIIVAALLFGALIVIFAGRITALGIDRFDPYLETKNDYAGLQSRISANRTLIEQLTREITETQHKYQISSAECISRSYEETSLPIKKPEEYKDQYNNLSSSARRGADFEDWIVNETANILQGYCASVDQKILLKSDNIDLKKKSDDLFGSILTFYSASLTEYAKEQSNSNGDGSQNEGGSGDTKITTNESTYQILLTSSVTRFGVLAIIIYLVQILIGLYRYNAMVAAHYRSSADVLVLSDNLQYTRMKNLQSILKPDVQYGKAPKSIPERVADGFHKNSNGPGGQGRRKDNAGGSTGD